MNTHMLRALQLAEKGKGHTGSNPMVGAVLVHEDKIISEGWHAQYGDPHAEADCLNKVKAEDRHLLAASTLYVTLEPCAHHGKTPPCATRIMEENIKSVVVSNQDPFGAVDGKGFSLLRNAGIEVTIGLMEQEGRWLNRRFFTFHEKKRPYIVLKWATSKDGFIAPSSLERTQLSNAMSQQMVHLWRTQEAAILVGYNTALHDNPKLTARLHQGKQPLRIAIDRNLSLPADHHLLDRSTPTWILNQLKEEKTGNLRRCKNSFGENLLDDLLDELYIAGITSLLVEGGAKLLTSFIDQGLWDEARIIHTNTMLQNGIPSPLLADACPMMDCAFGSDTIRCFTQSSTEFPYPIGFPL